MSLEKQFTKIIDGFAYENKRFDEILKQCVSITDEQMIKFAMFYYIEKIDEKKENYKSVNELLAEYKRINNL